MKQVCVIGIVSARAPDRAVASRPRLEILRVGRLGAVVTAARRKPSVTAANLRRHYDAVAAVAAATSAVLPVRFGTVMSVDEITFVLRTRRASLAAQLARVKGSVQMTVRLLDARGGEQTTMRSTRSQNRRPMSGTQYLRERAADVAGSRAPDDFAAVRRSVARWIRDERVTTQRGMTSVYHLVGRGAVRAYVRTLTEGARKAGVAIAVSGPFPPFAFADPVLLTP